MDKTYPKLREKFGKWEILDTTPVYKKDQRWFKVKCECGIKSTVHWGSLRLGKTKQCKACARKKRQGLLHIGDKFKEYIVIDNNPIIKNNSSYWKVRCSCGNEFDMLYSHIVHLKRWLKCKKCSDKENAKKYAIRMGQVGNVRISFINKCKKKAEVRGIEFSDKITPTYIYDLYIKQKERCALSGDFLILIPGIENKHFNNLSIDRKDSKKGYIVGNVQLVTKQINVSKHILNNYEFINMCKKVIDYC